MEVNLELPIIFNLENGAYANVYFFEICAFAPVFVEVYGSQNWCTKIYSGYEGFICPLQYSEIKDLFVSDEYARATYIGLVEGKFLFALGDEVKVFKTELFLTEMTI